MDINKKTANNKTELLKYFRDRSQEFISEVNQEYRDTEYKKKVTKINTLLVKSKNTLIDITKIKTKRENWTNQETLECVLMITYCNYVVMLEVRNSIWEYEYMAFSRRIGELWEPFCKLAFQYPINDIELFAPPLFTDVKKQLTNQIEEYIDKLSLESEQKEQLIKYYNEVWSLVVSGEIQLELDLHFIFDKKKYVVDFKSGFGSNEKGNTNRLLLVASIYQILEDDYQTLIFVRSDENNAYFNTLKASKTWQAFSGVDTYNEIKKYSGFDMKNWITKNVKWNQDLDKDFVKHLEEKKLMQYLTW